VFRIQTYESQMSMQTNNGKGNQTFNPARRPKVRFLTAAQSNEKTRYRTSKGSKFLLLQFQFVEIIYGFELGARFYKCTVLFGNNLSY